MNSSTSSQHLFILTGASRGMGLAMAKQLLLPGHQLLCLSRSLNELLNAQAKDLGVVLEAWRCDLSDSGPVAQQLQQWLNARSETSFVSATLINNAGMIPAITPLSQSTAEDLAQALRVGLEAPMTLSAAFLAATDGWGIPRKILNISSGLGRHAMASQSAYCAAKAGMDHFTRCLALDEASKPQGAKVCSLAPGVIDTDMQVQLRSADPSQFPDVARFASLHSQAQLTSPEEAATQVLAWLQHPHFGVEAIADVRNLQNK